MTTAPNRSPLDVARDYCGKNPAALPAGRYKVVDRVDRREPSPDNLTDSGTDKLLARAAAVKDTAEISPLAKAKPCNGCGRPTLGAFGPAPQLNYWASACQSCKDEADHALERKVARTARHWINFDSTKPPTDLGDGLGLEVPEPFCEATGPMVAVPVCATCGRTTLGSDECTDCARSRHNDDDAQGAAQERADAAELPDHND